MISAVCAKVTLLALDHRLSSAHALRLQEHGELKAHDTLDTF